MTYRGRHRANKFSIRVADLQAQIADEWIPTGRKFGNWDVVWNNGKEYLRLTAEVRFHGPDAAQCDVVKLICEPPEAAESLLALKGD